MEIVTDPKLKLIMFLFLIFSILCSQCYLFLDLSYLLFLWVEWCSFIAFVSGCVHVGIVLL